MQAQAPPQGGSTWEQFLTWYYPYFGFDTICEDRLFTSRALTTQQLFYFRAVVCLYTFILWWYVMLQNGEGTWFAYATNWTVLISTSFFTTSTYISYEKYRQGADLDLAASAATPLQSRFLLQFSMVVFEMAYAFSCAVVLIYWITEFPSSESRSGEPLYRNIHVHGFILVFLILEMMLSRIPFCKSHGLFVFSMVTIYVTFNGFYKLACCALYNVIKWDGVGSFFVACGLVGLVVGFFFSGFLLIRLREKIVDGNPAYANTNIAMRTNAIIAQEGERQADAADVEMQTIPPRK